MISCKTVEEFFGSAEQNPNSVSEARSKRSENSTDISMFLIFICK